MLTSRRQDLRRHYSYNGPGSFNGTVGMEAGRIRSRRQDLTRRNMYNRPGSFNGTVAVGEGIVHNALQERLFLKSDNIENCKNKFQ